MSTIKVAVLALCLLATLLPGCSQYEPPVQKFVLANPLLTQARDKKNTLSAATAFCKLETQRKGTKSIAGIVSRLRPGSAEKDFIACMKGRGYEVSQ